MALKFANNATGRLAVAISSTDDSLILQAGDGSKFPNLGSGDWFPVTVIRADSMREIMYVTSISGDVLTVERAQEGTAPISFSITDRVEMRLTAGILDRMMAATASNRPRLGDIRPWHGAIANISAVHGPGWQLADGTNGTIDLRDKFVVGAGRNYAAGDTGGADTVALNASQMPTHNHGINDPGHAHGVYDPTHAHSVYDPGHTHGTNAAVEQGGSSTGGGGFPLNARGGATIYGAGTGIGIYGAATGISIQGAGTGVSTQNAGSGAAHENRPPYFALAFIEYTGIGVVDPFNLAA